MFRGLLADEPAVDRRRGLLDGAGRAARAARACSTRYYADAPDGHRRARRADRRAAALRQPEGGRRRPDRQHRWPRTTCTAARAIVVDFGTSTNFDVVSARGEFLGGALAPGHRDLRRRARRPGRPAAQGRARPSRARSIGKNTVEALQSGMVYGFAGQVDGMVAPDRRPSSGDGPAVGHRHRRAGAAGHRASARPSPTTSPISR